jgi:diguanylate cyclase (GGDEF)-like protein
VFLIDIDHFKAVNDSLGHEAGDRILRQFADLLSGAVRKDDVVVRWGGEEFLVVLMHTAYGFIEAFAHQILDLVSSHEFTLGERSGKTLRKTCSVGYAPFPFHSEDMQGIGFEQVIALADLGLYHAKRNGRNRATGVLPAGRLPAPDQLSRMLGSLEYGVRKGYLRLVRAEEETRAAAEPARSSTAL